MKSKTTSFKAIVLVGALLAIESVGLSQGYVAFANTTASRFSTNSLYGGVPAIAAAAPVGSYYFELLVAPTSQTTINGSLTGWTDTGVMGTNTTLAGRMAGATYSDGLGVQIPGYGPTATANFAVLGWSANAGTTFSQALAVWNNGNPFFPFMGLSTVAINVPLSPAGGVYTDVWGPASSGLIQGMVLGVPEPSGLALIGLGTLVLFRRRK
jgi:hypothetical protein